MAQRSELDTLFARLANECAACRGQLQHNPPRLGKPATWQCVHCYREGDYGTAVSASGRKSRARVERKPGQPELRKPWAPAESMPYEERVA